MSAYALKDCAEFFAESAVAYLTGEVDENLFDKALHGSKSRAELRAKNPELYLAMKLFFEPDSPFFADLDCFSITSKCVIDNLLSSVYHDFFLDPNTSAAQIAAVYGADHSKYSLAEIIAGN